MWIADVIGQKKKKKQNKAVRHKIFNYLKLILKQCFYRNCSVTSYVC